MAHLQDKELYVLDAWAGTDPAYRLPIRIVNEFAWHNLFARNMFLPEDDPVRRAAHRPEFTVIDAPHFKADPARHGTRSEVFIFVHFGRRWCLSAAPLRRRDQEVHLHDPELHAPAAGRVVDALFGEHRRRRRHGALLRALWHGQDDALERSRAPPDRRRRAWVERYRRLQFRRRLLRQGHQAVEGGRATDLQHDTLRHHSRERGDRSGDTRARISTTRR